MKGWDSNDGHMDSLLTTSTSTTMLLGKKEKYYEKATDDGSNNALVLHFSLIFFKYVLSACSFCFLVRLLSFLFACSL